jgi:cytochrome c553
MRRYFILALMLLAVAVVASAQITTISTDVLGAHLNYGRGCAACHAPHSGQAGNGISNADDSTSGNMALWGQDVSALSQYGGLITTGQSDHGNYPEPLPSNFSTTTPDVTGLMTCLSCHDGNYAKGSHMLNVVYETLPATYGAIKPPTWLGNDGTTAGNYLNDHPVGLNATFSCNKPPTGQTYGGESGYNWDCGLAVDASTQKVTVTAGPNMASFVNNYGFFVSLAGYNGTATVQCTTCHNQHVMNMVKVNQLGTPMAAGGTVSGSGLPSGTYATMFFLRAPYNPADANLSTNQTAQFCRQCHGGESNEMNGSTAKTVF